jgi:hypothetical protein
MIYSFLMTDIQILIFPNIDVILMTYSVLADCQPFIREN